jgi:hypothetical protein
MLGNIPPYAWLKLHRALNCYRTKRLYGRFDALYRTNCRSISPHHPPTKTLRNLGETLRNLGETLRNLGETLRNLAVTAEGEQLVALPGAALGGAGLVEGSEVEIESKV